MRSRAREEGPVTETCTIYGEDTETIDLAYTCTMLHKQENMTDVVIPRYHERSRAGEIFNNPVSYVLTDERSLGGGSYVAKWPDGRIRQSSSAAGSVTETIASVTSYSLGSTLLADLELDVTLDAEAKAKALSHVDKTPYAFLEDVLELRETLRFLRNPFSSMRRLSRRFRKDVGNRRGSSRTKAIADAWLEYQFAFLPLVRSSVDLYDLLVNFRSTRPRRLTARGFSEDEKSDAEIVTLSDSTWSRNRLAKVKHRAGILYEVSNPLEGFRFEAGLRAKDIPEALWAIFPYSFMVDRVVDISGGIRGVTNLLDPDVRLLASWVAVKKESLVNDRLIDRTYSPYTYEVSGDNYLSKYFTYFRNPWTPSTSDAFPPSDLAGLISDATRIADLGALIIKNLR